MYVIQQISVSDRNSIMQNKKGAIVQSPEYDFRTLVENCFEGMAIISPEGVPLYIAPSIESILGYTADEAINLNIAEICHEDALPVLMNVLKTACELPGKTIHYPAIQIKHKNGQWLWMEGSVTNMLHVAGINGIVDNFKDVTARIIAENRVKESENKYRSYFDNSTDGIVISVAGGAIIDANPAACAMFQMTVDEIRTAGRDKLADLTASHVQDAIKVREEKGSAKTSITFIRKDGTRFPGEINSVSYLTANGEQRTSMLIRDLTEQRESEEKLIYANRLYGFISQLNQCIVHAQDEETLLREACRIAVSQGTFRFAWIGFANPDNKRMPMAAYSGETDADLDFFHDYEYNEGGPIDRVLKGYNYFVIADINKQDNKKWNNYATSRGFKSAISIAIKRSGDTVGIFNLYSTEKHFFTADEITLLEDVTADISYALDVLEKEKMRTEAERKLKYNEHRLKETQALAHIGSWHLNLLNNTAVWSDEALRIYGIAPGNHIQPRSTWFGYVHPEDLEYVKSKTKYAVSSRLDTSFFHRIVRADGVVRNIYTIGQFEFDDSGEPLSLYGIAHDITNMKQAEEALEKSSADLEVIFENTSEGFVLIDTETKIRTFNSRAQHLLLHNTSKKAAAGKSIIDFVPENIREDYREVINRVIGGETISYDYFFRNPHGEDRWFSFVKSPVYASGKIVSVCITGSDITERKNAEAAMLEREYQYRRIVETAQEGIWILDKDDRVTFVNKKMCELLEYTDEEIIGKANTYFMDSAGKKVAARVSERRKKGIKESVDIGYITKSGKQIWAIVSATPIFDDAEEYTGVLAMSSDITEKKQLETLLEKTNNLALIGSYELELETGNLYWSSVTKQIHEVDEDYKPDLESAIQFYKSGCSRERLLKAMEEAKKFGTSWDLELEVGTAKGNFKWVRNVGNAEFADNKCVRLYGSFQDIDARKRAETEVLKAYKEKNVILESISDAFFAVDKNWFVTYWNKEAEIILNTTKADIIGKNLWDVFNDGIHTPSYIHYQTAIRENKAVHFETYYPKRNMWLEVSAYPSPTGLAVYFKNITDKKILHKQLLNEQMTKQLEITKAVVNAQEKERREIGEELHDNVCQLLAACKLYIKHSLSQADPKDSVLKCEEYLGTAMKEIRKLSHALVGPADDKSIGLIESLDELIDSISAVEPIKFHFCHKNFKEENTEPGLKLSIYRIVQEQLNNILKHAEASSVTIVLEQANEQLLVIITDDGHGFDTGTKKTGIGLKNMQNRVAVYNGKMTVSSQPGKGCRLEITYADFSDSILKDHGSSLQLHDWKKLY